MTSTATPDQLAQAASLREAARQSRIRSLESFERCDTDGCVSQWAADSMARLYDVQAEILENGGVAEFPALFDIDGNMLDAREVQTRYGWAWAVTTLDGGTAWFNPSHAQDETRRIATNRRKGYYVGRISAPAWAANSGRGVSITPVVFRSDKDGDVTVIDNGIN